MREPPFLALRELLAAGPSSRRSLDLATRRVIGLKRRGVRSLKPLAQLESAESVLLSGNPLVADLSPLLTLGRLRFLDISGTQAESEPQAQEILQTLVGKGVTIRTSSQVIRGGIP